MPLLEIKNLYQNMEGQDILKDINIEIDKGEILAIIGPTGAGKTTLLRLISTLDTPSSGKVLINGTDITDPTTSLLGFRRSMAFVLQKPIVYNMSVFDNITLGLKWRGIGKEEIMKQTGEMLELIGLSEYKNRNARTLSGGEIQRVAIARAVISEPEILLLDEPNANLDPNSATYIEELITDIITKYGITTIMATHDLAQGQRMADRVAVLLNGKIMQTGDWHEVFSAPGNREIASFVGVENIIDGEITSCQDELVIITAGDKTIEAITDLPAGEKVSVCIRPEDITVSTSRTSTSARNSFAGTIKNTVSFGALTRLAIDCGFTLIVLVTSRSAAELELVKGKEVYISFKATAIHVISKE